MRLSDSQRIAQKMRRKRQDFGAFAALIETPGDLSAGFRLPANAEIFISTNEDLESATILIDGLGAPAQDADVKHHVGRLNRSKLIKRNESAPGTVSVWIRDPAGVLRKIGESEVMTRLPNIPGRPLRQEGPTEDIDLTGWSDIIFFSRIVVSYTTDVTSLGLVTSGSNTGDKSIILGVYSVNGMVCTLVPGTEVDTLNGGSGNFASAVTLRPGVYLLASLMGADVEEVVHSFVSFSKGSHLYGEFGCRDVLHLHGTTESRVAFSMSSDYEDGLPASVNLAEDLDPEETAPLMVAFTAS